MANKMKWVKVLNAVGHSIAGLAGVELSDDQKVFVDYETSDGTVFPSVGHYPVIALKAKNGSQLLKVLDQAIEQDISHTVFTHSMTIGGTEEQLAETKQLGKENQEYIAVALFGDTEKLKSITGKFSLYR